MYEREIEDFWKQKQESIPEKILFQTMARIESPSTEQPWCLWFGTESSIYFQFFKTRSWFDSMLNQKSKGENIETVVARENCIEIKCHPGKKLFGFINLSEGRVFINFNEKMKLSTTLNTDRLILNPLIPVKNIAPFFE